MKTAIIICLLLTGCSVEKEKGNYEDSVSIARTQDFVWLIDSTQIPVKMTLLTDSIEVWGISNIYKFDERTWVKIK